MRGYRELAKGNQLIALSQTIRAGGYEQRGKQHLPKLAVCRAHAEWVWLTVESDGRVAFQEERYMDARHKLGRHEFPAGTVPEGQYIGAYSEYKAMVPIIPPEYRPPHNLSNYHILWEAEWKREPPKDPALLKHVGGDLYAVLAVWDLTEVERAVLAERFQS